MATALNLPIDQVHILHASLNLDPELSLTLIQSLSADETARANRFLSETHRRRFAVARGILRLLLGAYLDCEPARIEFGYGASGKPTLAEVSETVRLFFNVSHSDEVAAYALTSIAPVGVDIKMTRPGIDVDGIAAEVFSSAERAMLRDAPGGKALPLFYRMWTRKEAYAKVHGHGLVIDLRETDVSSPASASEHWFPVRVGGIPAENMRLQDLNLQAGYAAAIAIESAIEPEVVVRSLYDWRAAIL